MRHKGIDRARYIVVAAICTLLLAAFTALAFLGAGSNLVSRLSIAASIAMGICVIFCIRLLVRKR